MRERFYFPVLQALAAGWSQLDNRKFLAIFQGLTLAGPQVFTPEIANQVLNLFMDKLASMNFDEVISFLELLIKYTRMSLDSQSVGELIDRQAVMEQVNDNYMSGRVKALSLMELASLYWVTDALGTQWS